MKKILTSLIIFVTIIISLISCSSNGCTSKSSCPNSSDNQPTVELLIPKNHATGITLSPIIQFQFNKIVQNVNSTTVSLHQGSTNGQLIAISQITAGANNTYTFSPITNLNSNTTYYLVLESGITDTSGNNLSTTNFYFTTGDFVAPTVAMINPFNNGTNIGLSPIIQLQFSETVQNVNSTTVSLHQGSTNGQLIAISQITAGANNTYTFSPITNLNSNTTYYLVLESGITDTSGNNLSATNFNFTTGDFIVPTVAMINPVNNESNVELVPTLQLQFSKTVQNVNSTTISLHQHSINGDLVAIGSITSETNNIYTFSPESSLNPLTLYYIVVDENITDSSGNHLTTTYFEFTTTTDINLLWAKQVGAIGGVSTAVGVGVDANRNSYVFGDTSRILFGETQYGAYDYFLAKYDNAGNLVCGKQVGGGNLTLAFGITVDVNGNSYVTGSTDQALSGQTQLGGEDYYVAKYDNNCNLLWARQVGATQGVTRTAAISNDISGNIYVTGYTNIGISGQSKQGINDYFIAKYDNNGNLLWAKQVGTSGGNTFGQGIGVDSSGNSYVGGYTSMGISGQIQQGLQDYFIAKYDSNGDLLWAKQVGTSGGNAYGAGLSTDSSGNSYITGYTNVGISGQSKQGINDYFIAKYATNGTLQWAHQVGSTGGVTTGVGINVDSNGNSYVTGYTNIGIAGQTKQGVQDFFITKYAGDGTLLSAMEIGTPGSSAQSYGIAIDNINNVYISGYTNGGLYSDSVMGLYDYFIVKY